MANPQVTADNLDAVEAFLNAPQALIWFQCKRCHSFFADNDFFIQDLYPFSLKFLLFDHPYADLAVMPRPYNAFPVGPHRLFLGEGGPGDADCIDCRKCGNWLGYKILTSNCAVSSPGRFVLIHGNDDVIGIEAIFRTSDDLNTFDPTIL